MNNFPTVKTFIFDPVPLASHIEDVAGHCLVPAEVIIPVSACVRTVHHPASRLTKDTGTNIKFMLNARTQSQLHEASAFPAVGMEIIKAVLSNMLLESSAWVKQKAPSFEELLRPYVQEVWQDKDEVYDNLHALLFDLQNDVRAFLGPERWIMHFIKERGTDIMIEKSIDYRIHDWTRRMAEGEWK